VPASRATPASLQTQLKKEIGKWGPVIKKAGVYAD
jgi:tripartite-type tricarboxylate transporter receptor subunit TctC